MKTLLREYVRLVSERSRQAQLSKDRNADWGSTDHITDLEARLSDASYWRDKHPRGSEKRAHFKGIVSHLKRELQSARKSQQKQLTESDVFREYVGMIVEKLGNTRASKSNDWQVALDIINSNLTDGQLISTSAAKTGSGKTDVVARYVSNDCVVGRLYNIEVKSFSSSDTFKKEVTQASKLKSSIFKSDPSTSDAQDQLTRKLKIVGKERGDALVAAASEALKKQVETNLGTYKFQEGNDLVEKSVLVVAGSPGDWMRIRTQTDPTSKKRSIYTLPKDSVTAAMIVPPSDPQERMQYYASIEDAVAQDFASDNILVILGPGEARCFGVSQQEVIGNLTFPAFQQGGQTVIDSKAQSFGGGGRYSLQLKVAGGLVLNRGSSTAGNQVAACAFNPQDL